MIAKPGGGVVLKPGGGGVAEPGSIIGGRSRRPEWWRGGRSQADLLRGRVLDAAGSAAFCQLRATEYARSRRAVNGQMPAEDEDGPCTEELPARWSAITARGNLKAGGVFQEANGYVRIRRREFVDGYDPRVGDLVRPAPEAGESSRWWQVAAVTAPARALDGEWKLELKSLEG